MRGYAELKLALSHHVVRAALQRFVWVEPGESPLPALNILAQCLDRDLM